MIINTKYSIGQKVAYKEGQNNEILKFGEIVRIEVVKEKDNYKEVYMVSDKDDPESESILYPEEMQKIKYIIDTKKLRNNLEDTNSV